MSGHSSYTPSNGFSRWLDDRLPIVRLAHDSFVSYPTPRNLNYFWTFGGILSLMLVAQIITGIVLAMHYFASADGAFNSVEAIMRDVNAGWMLRYAHANGASFFFIAVYIHIFRGLYFGSYKAPRELLWMFGVTLLLLMMAMERVGATVAAQAGMIGPLSTILMGIVVLGEPFTGWIVAGTVLVLAGIWLLAKWR